MMMSLLIPKVIRKGDYLTITFVSLQLPPRLFKESKYPGVCRVCARQSENCDILHVKVGDFIYDLGHPVNQQWTLCLPYIQQERGAKEYTPTIATYKGTQYDISGI